jgi:hypothetical protein
MEKALQQAESACEAFALRQHVVMLSLHRQNFSKDIEERFLFLCQRLREKMRFLMPSY